jgi:hypothetical protein
LSGIILFADAQSNILQCREAVGISAREAHGFCKEPWRLIAFARLMALERVTQQMIETEDAAIHARVTIVIVKDFAESVEANCDACGL